MMKVNHHINVFNNVMVYGTIMLTIIVLKNVLMNKHIQKMDISAIVNVNIILDQIVINNVWVHAKVHINIMLI